MTKSRTRDRDCAGHSRRHRLRNPERYLWKSAKRRAARLGLPFNLDVEDVVIPQRCPVLGIPIFMAEGKQCDNSPSLDRIKGKLGYVKGNIEVISWRANNLKKDASPKELKKLARYYGKEKRDRTTTKNSQGSTS